MNSNNIATLLVFYVNKKIKQEINKQETLKFFKYLNVFFTKSN